MPRLIRPYFIVQLGDRTFQNKDGILRAVAVELGEDKRSSRNRVEVSDPNWTLGAALFDISFAEGGIVVDSELLADPDDDSESTTLISVTGNTTQNTDLSARERAFLDTIAFAEGTQNPDGYRTMFTGAKFEGFDRHPDIVNESNGLSSTAAGRYQFLTTTWDSLNLPDFSPENQDTGAIELIRRRGALPDVQAGNFETAVNKVALEWASMPGSPYGQPTKTMDELREVYLAALAIYDSDIASTERARTTAVEEKTPVTEESQKGRELIVAIGFSPDNLISYHFIHVGSQISGRAPDTLALEGQSIRWLMTRRQRQVGYESLTLRQLAQRICDRYNIKLQMEGDGPLLQYIDQSSTDYALLLRECSRIGYKITETNDTLILAPVRANRDGVTLTRAQILPGSLTIRDRASEDMPGMRDGSPALGYVPNKANEQSIHIDRLTGQPIQDTPEDPVGAGSEVTAMNMGLARPTATVAPSSRPGGIASDSETGLPTQAIGLVDLQDGTAEAAEIEDEGRRVMGYRGSAQLITDPEILTLAPGSVFTLGSDVAPHPFNREWRLHFVRHEWRLGSPLTTTIEFYSPQRQRPPKKSDNNQQLISTSNPTGHILPITSGILGDGVGPRSPDRQHRGIDVAAPTGTPILASADGVVVRSTDPDGTGWGTHIVVKHANNIYSLVGHLSRRDVGVNTEVTQGQKIGEVGSTGFSTGPHLHVEWRSGPTFSEGDTVIPSTLGVTYGNVTGEQRAGFEY